jgi:hypothetical protein
MCGSGNSEGGKLMKASEISAALTAMAKARDFIRNNVQPSVQEMMVRHELDDASSALKSALKKIEVEVTH